MVTELQILGNVTLAIILSAIIGIERELADKPAGFRTHMLVGGSAALLVGISGLIVDEFDISSNLIRIDPIRVIEAIIAGVSFLGAGTIFRSRDNERTEGLTTAASLLFVAGLGVSVAAARFILAIGATLIVLLVLRLGKRLESRFLQWLDPDDRAQNRD
ncbi:MAG: MgtC/SapB family protein [Caldilineaceae bacterium]|nr:MgtC/SapB family protein [Caldilineaceae bacterium]